MVKLTASRPLKRAAALLATAVLGCSAVVATATPAAAVTCYGDYCSGKDPQATGCASGASTSAVREFSQGSTRGVLEVRYSPTCKTNWTRVTVYSVGNLLQASAGTVKSIQDSGYTTSANVPRPTETVQVWTPMIYSPVRLVKGQYTTDTNPCRVGCNWSRLVVETAWA